MNRYIKRKSKGEHKMNANEKLVDYILSLTEEQVDKLINRLPQLTSLLEEASPLCSQEQTEQNQ